MNDNKTNQPTPSATDTMYVIVLATDAAGSPAFHTCMLEVTREQYNAGEHYEMAKENAAFNGYEEPMIAFDRNDEAGRQMRFGDEALWLHNRGGWSEVNPAMGADFERAVEYQREQIDEGGIDLDDLPRRLVRYGLMPAASFAAEMLERTDPSDPDEFEEEAPPATVGAAPASRLAAVSTPPESDPGL